MNIILWVLQVLLALHTAVGAVWKFSKTAEQTMASLKAIPDVVWLMMALIELLCSVGLVLPSVQKPWGILAPIAALIIVLEMLLFCGFHLNAAETNSGPLIYWLVVASIAGFIAYGRFALTPIVK